jgi:hypothetical protein
MNFYQIQSSDPPSLQELGSGDIESKDCCLGRGRRNVGPCLEKVGLPHLMMLWLVLIWCGHSLGFHRDYLSEGEMNINYKINIEWLL